MIYTRDTIVGDVATYETIEGDVEEVIAALKAIESDKDTPPPTINAIADIDVKALKKDAIDEVVKNIKLSM